MSPADLARYRHAMASMVRAVLFDRAAGLITVEPVAYDMFLSRHERMGRLAHSDDEGVAK